MKMARKTKVEAVKGQAKAETPVQPKTTVVAGDMDDLMLATVVNTVATKKPAKKDVEDVHLSDPAQKAKLALLLRYSARKAAAEARAEGLKGELRPIFEKMYFDLAHAQKAFLKTVCVDDACNYSAGNVGVVGVTGKNAAELKASFTTLRTKLTELFGPEGYKKYIRSTSVMRVAMTKENLDILKAKLTTEEYEKVITYIPGLDVVEEGIGQEKFVPLKRDMSVDPAIDAVVRKGVAAKLLTLSNGAVMPQKTALAVVEEELLKEEKDKDEAAAAKAAGLSAGAMAGAMVEAAVVVAGSH
jgi:hypothetical protein